MSDIDGLFTLSHARPFTTLTFSYVGYYPAVVHAGKGRLLVEMVRRPIELAPVEVMAGENPAHRIISQVMEHRDANHPERQGPFSYNAYNKFVFTGALSEGGPGPAEEADTLPGRLARYLEDHHFFLMETVTERRFMPPSRNNETILASRVSGFQNPLFALIITQMQSFSFYDDQIEIYGSRYLSPLAPGSLNRYTFLLEDTLLTEGDSVFVISYRPQPNRNFEGLRGLLYVSANGWALQNVIAAPAGEGGNARIRIQQRYERVDGRQWFPVQLHTDFEILNLEGMGQFKVVGMGRSYLRDIQLDASLGRNDFSPFDLAFSPRSILQDEAFWNDRRVDSLDSKERNTYHRLDSIGRDGRLDKQMNRYMALFSGSLRWGVFDISLPGLLGFNEVEGLRAGLSLRTNAALFERLVLSGRVAYGFRDGRVKYGGGGEWRLDRLTDLWLGYDYQRDVEERGGSVFLEPQSPFPAGTLRNYFLQTLDMTGRHAAWLQGRAWRNFLTWRAHASLEDVLPMDDYRFVPDSLSQPAGPSGFRFFETGLQLRLAYGERFVLTSGPILSFGGRVPVLHLSLSKGWKGPMGGGYDYWRAEASLRHRFPVRMLGSQQFTLLAGMTGGDAPWQKLFTAPGTYRPFSVAVPGAFATMRADEFVSDRYVALFWQHDFENLIYRSVKFNPRLLLLTRLGAGALSQPSRHLNAGFATMEKGFFESGFALLDLLGSGFTSLGFEVMVRYGPYTLPEFRDNLSFRLSYSLLF
jgi:hypothetical protein